MSQKLTIVALGWLGQAVYNSFSRSFECSGSFNSKSKDLDNEYRFDINSFEAVPARVLDADILFFNLPPSKVKDLDRFKSIISCFKSKRVVLISSTSVYEQDGNVDENSKILYRSDRAKKQVDLENIVIEEVENHLILRCAGLYSSDRHPGYYLSGKKDIKGVTSSVNLISRSDILDILKRVILKSDEKIINLVNQIHPKKKEYYNGFCQRHDLEMVDFNNKLVKDKIVGTIYPHYKINSKLP